MTEISVVRRYARALFDVARQQERVEQVGSDLQGIDAVLKSSPRLLRVLRAPTIPGADKIKLVRSAFGRRVNELTLRFLQMVIEKRREGILPELAAEYRRLSFEMLNIQSVEVTSAVALTDEERARLAVSLGRRTGKRIQLVERTDPNLM